ncbi:MAG: hypothetical protein WB780_11740 [Candidatus Acidiferrales bacterium]
MASRRKLSHSVLPRKTVSSNAKSPTIGPTCGCTITTQMDGFIDMQGPPRIVYCKLHYAAPKLLEALHQCRKLVDAAIAATSAAA